MLLHKLSQLGLLILLDYLNPQHKKTEWILINSGKFKYLGKTVANQYCIRQQVKSMTATNQLRIFYISIS